MKHKRIKSPPPEFFRYQSFYSDIDHANQEKCCECGRSIGNGIHDLGLDLIYCFRCADEDGVKGGDKI